jgi:hypothetical protein
MEIRATIFSVSAPTNQQLKLQAVSIEFFAAVGPQNITVTIRTDTAFFFSPDSIPIRPQSSAAIVAKNRFALRGCTQWGCIRAYICFIHIPILSVDIAFQLENIRIYLSMKQILYREMWLKYKPKSQHVIS